MAHQGYKRSKLSLEQQACRLGLVLTCYTRQNIWKQIKKAQGCCVHCGKPRGKSSSTVHCRAHIKGASQQPK